MTESVKSYVHGLGRHAREAASQLAKAETADKNAALQAIAGQLQTAKGALQQANAKDLEKGRKKGLDAALLDRLELTSPRVDTMIENLHQVAALPDPVGTIDDLKYVPSGIQVGRMRVPLGVIGIIYESRPNVTIEAASLCLKAGNAVILRGGSEAIASNQSIAHCIQKGLEMTGLPASAVQVIGITDREAVGALISIPEFVDVIVPRGGKGLIERISREARVPVIKHLDGICHVYLDDRADKDKAMAIAINAKTHRYGVCNAMETLLVHKGLAQAWLPELAGHYQQLGVELRGCPETCRTVPGLVAASDEDWVTEYLGPVLSVKVVEGVNQAIDHINRYGSHHTDSIVTEDYDRGRRFLREVDSSSVMINTSTRYADGFEYGLGAEIGISTDKIHARGPVGLEGLTSQKYVVMGSGHIRK